MDKLKELLQDRPKLFVAVGLVLLLLISKFVIRLDDYKLEDNPEANGLVTWMLFTTYFLITVCLIGSFILFGIRMYQNLDVAKRFGILIGGIIVVFGICYGTATSDVSTMPAADFTASNLKLIGSLVSFTFTLILFGLIGAVLSEIYKAVK